MRGEPAEPPTTNDASWLLNFYETFMDASDEDVTQAALGALAKLRGNFAFVLYDAGGSSTAAHLATHLLTDRPSHSPICRPKLLADLRDFGYCLSDHVC